MWGVCGGGALGGGSAGAVAAAAYTPGGSSGDFGGDGCGLHRYGGS